MNSAIVKTNNQPLPQVSQSKISTILIWALLGIFLVNSMLFSLTNFDIFPIISPSINITCLTLAAFIHGFRRYGIKNLLVFFLISWSISTFLEATSIHTGFPFSLYKYVNVPGPRFLDVPYVVGPSCFGMSYVCWMLANLLMEQFGKRLEGGRKFTIPIIASFIMVMWDYCLDPIYSTIYSMWVWPKGGSYFGVPIANFAGWFFYVYIIFQIFGLYISKYDKQDNKDTTAGFNKLFWVEIIVAYFFQGLLFFLFQFSRTEHVEIYQSMGLAFVMTMLFVIILSCSKLKDIKKISL